MKFWIETNSWILYKVVGFYFVSLLVFPSLLSQILLNLWDFGQFSTANGKSCWKMSEMKILGALWAEKLQNEKCKEFCGTPCNTCILQPPNHCWKQWESHKDKVWTCLCSCYYCLCSCYYAVDTILSHISQHSLIQFNIITI